MKFEKEQLNFLHLFSLYADNSINGDKTRVLIQDDKIYFCQFGLDSKLIYVMNNIHNIENNEHIFVTSQLNSLIKMCKDDDVIEIKDGYIILGSNAKYKISEYEYEDVSPLEVIDYFNTANKIIIKELNKINMVKDFVGKDTGYNVIAIMNNHFVTYNEFVLGFVSTENIIKNDMIPFSMQKFIEYMNMDEMEFSNINDNFYGISLNDKLYCVFEKRQHHIPFIFDEEYTGLYEHTNKIIVDTKELKQKLQRISIVSKENLGNKIYIECDKNKIKLQTREEPIGEEVFDADVESELEGFYVKVYCGYLQSIVNKIVDEKIEIWITPDKETIQTITVKGIESNARYVCVLSEYDEDME